MNIGIIGLGYVGVVTGVCLSSIGHKIYGCDISNKKLEMLGNGEMPFLEKDCDKLLSDSIKNKNIFFSNDLEETLHNSDLIFICVGTPSDKTGAVNLSFLKNVIFDISKYIQKAGVWKGICVRSTIPPGTVKNLVLPMFENNIEINNFYSVAFCPEFLREGNSVDDFLRPPLTVMASSDDKIKSLLCNVWKTLPGNFEIHHLSFEEAEIYKYASNAFHALKISFANEIALISKSYNANPGSVMNVLVSDTTLNISPKYLKPGFAFGGSCLPKDLRAIETFAKNNNIKIPVLSNILKSNDFIIHSSANYILKKAKKSIGFAGLSFKDGTDDLRESPVLKLIYLLKEKFDKISIYDENIKVQKFNGVNLDIWNEFLDIIDPKLYNSPSSFITSVDTIVVYGNQKELNKCFDFDFHDIKIIDLNKI